MLSNSEENDIDNEVFKNLVKYQRSTDVSKESLFLKRALTNYRNSSHDLYKSGKTVSEIDRTKSINIDYTESNKRY